MTVLHIQAEACVWCHGYKRYTHFHILRDPEGKSFIPFWVVIVGHCFCTAGLCCCSGKSDYHIAIRFGNCNTERRKEKKVDAVISASYAVTNCHALCDTLT